MKRQTILLALLLFFVALTAEAGDSSLKKSILKEGVSLGCVIAVVISWDRNKSILLAIIHAVMSWVYVVYAALTRD